MRIRCVLLQVSCESAQIESLIGDFAFINSTDWSAHLLLWAYRQYYKQILELDSRQIRFCSEADNLVRKSLQLIDLIVNG